MELNTLLLLYLYFESIKGKFSHGSHIMAFAMWTILLISDIWIARLQ